MNPCAPGNVAEKCPLKLVKPLYLVKTAQNAVYKAMFTLYRIVFCVLRFSFFLFNEQNNNSARASRFFVHFFAFTAQLRREMTKF